MTSSPLRRVHVVCTEIPPDLVGGLGRYIERLMPALSGLDTPIDLYGAGGRPAVEVSGAVTMHRIATFGVRLDRPVPGPRPVQMLIRLVGVVVFNVRVAVQILRARGGRSGTVVAVHDWMGCIAGILCRVIGRMPVIFHVHTRELNDAPSRRISPVSVAIGALEAAQKRLATLIVVPSTGMRDILSARNWPADRIRVVPHGAEHPGLTRLATGEAVPPPGRLVLFAGRLAPHKGVLTLLRAARQVVAKAPDAQFLLIGAPNPVTDERAQVEALIEGLHLTRHVTTIYRFLPSDQLYAHMLAADLCVFPSTYEPFGLIAVEAMALARPVIVGPGYSPEVTGDGALRYAHDSPSDLARAIVGCLDDPQAAAQLAARGQEYVRHHHSWPAVAQHTLTVYAEAATWRA